MKKTIEVINKLKTEKLINDYAIGGAVAALKWVEPFFTRDLDIFIDFVHEPTKNEIIILEPIYDYLKKNGYDKWTGQWIVIEGLPVEFIPAVGITKEALINAIKCELDGTETKVMTPEYLIALFLIANRYKDKMKLRLLLEQSEINTEKLTAILDKYGLNSRFELFITGESNGR